MSGTATTTYDYSGQQMANAMNSARNAVAARRFYNAQNRELGFAQFLAAMNLDSDQTTINPKSAAGGVIVFQQLKPKKAPFTVTISIGGEVFTFRYRE